MSPTAAYSFRVAEPTEPQKVKPVVTPMRTAAARQIQQLPSEVEGPLLVVLVQDGSAEEDDEEAPFVTHFDLAEVAVVRGRRAPRRARSTPAAWAGFRVAVVVEAFEADEQDSEPAVLVDEAFEAPMKALHDDGMEKRRQRR